MTSRFFATTSIVGLAAAALLPTAAFAQDEQAPAATDTGEIVVTAQRREERNVDVPITVANLSAATLTTANVQELPDIVKVTPGVRFDFAGGFFQPTIRGVGTPVATSGGGSNVGIYIDGFYSPNPLAADFNLTKVTSIQVLKGPQGTLFGHNTTGGAILVQTADPSVVPSADLKVSYGRFNELRAQAYGTFGFSDRVAMDFEALYKRGDGWQTNISNGQRVGDYEDYSFRVGFKAWLTDDITVMVRYQHSEVDDPAPALTSSYRDSVFGSGAPNYALPSQITFDPDQVATGAAPEDQEFLRVKSDVVQGTIKADLGFANLTSYTQFRKENVDSNLELDYSGAPIFELRLPNKNKTWSQELLLTSKPGTKLQWTAGFFAFSNRDIYLTYLSLNNPPNDPFRIGGSGTDTNTVAGFVDATYEITPQLFVTGGLRYSHDSVTNAYYNALNSSFQITVNPLASISSNHWTPRAVIQYRPNDHSNIYASYTQGYKSALIDAGGSCQNPPNFACNDVKSEKIHAYEVGYKYDDRTLSVELSAFYYDYKNLQVSVYLAGRANILNAANSRIYGLDGQIRYRFSDNFELNAGAAWTHARYVDFIRAPIYVNCSAFPAGSGANCADPGISSNGVSYIVIGQDLHDVTMQRAPEFTASLGARYKTELAGGELALSGNLYYSSKFFFGPSGIQFPQDAYATLSLRAQWTDPSDHYTIALWGDNVTNSRYLTQVQNSSFGHGANWSKPATFGVELGAHF